jgi:hypothetical protein
MRARGTDKRAEIVARDTLSWKDRFTTGNELLVTCSMVVWPNASVVLVVIVVLIESMAHVPVETTRRRRRK